MVRGGNQNGGPGFCMFALMSRRVRGSVEDVGPDRGNPYLSVKLDDPSFVAAIGSMRARSEADAEDIALPSVPRRCAVN